ncbi:MAG: hypothetical protein IPO53_14305 [Chitinophagaceae bacterium]|nr:hypothetical protein [Chitinophagaceae bacterium]
MKKQFLLILPLLVLITINSIAYSQEKSYISVEGGAAFLFTSNQISTAMKANGFGDNYDFDALFSETGRTQHPDKRDTKLNYRFRYGYFLRNMQLLKLDMAFPLLIVLMVQIL